MSDDLAYTIAGIGRKRDPYADRRTFAQRMLAQGMDTSPIQSPWQGAARLAQAIAGGLLGQEADRDEKKATEDRNAKLAASIAKMKTDPEGGLAEAASLDPEYGLRAASQLAIEKVKLGQQREGLQTAANSFGASYGGPQASPSGPIGAGPPLPSGQSNASGFNNNLGNLRTSNANWQGKGAPHNGFETFNTPQDGANAMFQNLGAYVKANPGMTVAQAIQKWAPPNENDTNLYIRQVMESTGINPAMPLAEVLQDPAVAAILMDAMTRKEKGGLPQGVNADTFMTATTPRGAPQGQPQPLTINMGGPGGIPQGSAENVGMPPQPSPQGVQGPTMMAQAPQAPAIPDVPRPQPTPQQIQQYRQRIASGEFGNDQSAGMRAQKALDDELDRDWAVQRERAKMQFEQQSRTYTEDRKPTEAQKAVDTNFGKDYAEWVAGGGMADTRRQIVQLEEVLGKLKKKRGTFEQNLTGAGVGMTPDWLLNVVNPDAVSARNAVEEVVQRNLRVILGAQFTKEEGERLIARAYNPSLGEAENAKRVERLLNQIKEAAAAKVSAGQFYEQNGTLRGWSGKLPTLADFAPDARPDRGSKDDLRKKYGLE
ncbi:MAG TPA: hypothetical protein VGE09_08555 [Pseudoxanthomonas sp.]